MVSYFQMNVCLQARTCSYGELHIVISTVLHTPDSFDGQEATSSLDYGGTIYGVSFAHLPLKI